MINLAIFKYEYGTKAVPNNIIKLTFVLLQSSFIFWKEFQELHKAFWKWQLSQSVRSILLQNAHPAAILQTHRTRQFVDLYMVQGVLHIIEDDGHATPARNMRCDFGMLMMFCWLVQNAGLQSLNTTLLQHITVKPNPAASNKKTKISK
ncbi:hypothetical protein MAR_014673 [Mya arenaria]|uniref:Uncharacterized protein n=1 Tax=Mya arenaria TaxID=6604 RepID=A0ABY7DL01_MYAAR|nr:hypothetical protein MAR_030072 [Mya arenaria]WAR20699.1 hypothetical protein MAR_014673 [Mya arenaria]